jgi:hypothetical protein
VSCICYNSRGAAKNNEKRVFATANNSQEIQAIANSEAGILP